MAEAGPQDADRDSIGLNDQDKEYLEAHADPHKIANKPPPPEQRLRLFSVVCFIVNRMIGRYEGLVPPRICMSL